MRRDRLMLVVLVVALLLIPQVVAAEQLPQETPRLPLAHGTIEAVSVEGFTLRTEQGEVSVSVTSQTRYHVPGVARPRQADLRAGDAVLISGRWRASGQLDAQHVLLLPPVTVGVCKGTVTVAEPQRLVVRTRAGARTLLIDANTQYRIPGVTEPAAEDVQVGVRLLAIVEARDRVLLAKTIALLPEGAINVIAIRGRVTPVSESLLRVSVRGRNVSVHLTDTTQLRVPEVEAPSHSDIGAGDWVLVVGRVTGFCQVQAAVVGVLPPMSAHRFVIAGEVLEVRGSALIVQDARDTHVIYAQERTRVNVLGVKEPTIGDIAVGHRVLAVGKPTEGRNLLAAWIGARPHSPEADETTGAPRLITRSRPD